MKKTKRMKKLLTVMPILAMFLLAPCALADEKRGYLREDPIFKDRTNIYDSQGKREGHLRRDPIFEDKVNIYDDRGRKTGYMRRDPVFEDRVNIYKK